MVYRVQITTAALHSYSTLRCPGPCEVCHCAGDAALCLQGAPAVVVALSTLLQAPDSAVCELCKKCFLVVPYSQQRLLLHAEPALPLNTSIAAMPRRGKEQMSQGVRFAYLSSCCCLSSSCVCSSLNLCFLSCADRLENQA